MGIMMPYPGPQRPIAEEFNCGISKISSYESSYSKFGKND